MTRKPNWTKLLKPISEAQLLADLINETILTFQTGKGKTHLVAKDSTLAAEFYATGLIVICVTEPNKQ